MMPIRQLPPEKREDLAFERTTDLDLIRQVITHPRVWSGASDDFAPEPSAFQPALHPACCYVAVRDGEEALGLFLFVALNAICWEVHTCLLPRAWGRRAKQAATGVVDWIWEQTDCQRIVTAVPAFNRLALKLAHGAGLVEYGRNPDSYMKHEKLWDQILLGISRPPKEQ